VRYAGRRDLRGLTGLLAFEAIDVQVFRYEHADPIARYQHAFVCQFAYGTMRADIPRPEFACQFADRRQTIAKLPHAPNTTVQLGCNALAGHGSTSFRILESGHLALLD